MFRYIYLKLLPGLVLGEVLSLWEGFGRVIVTLGRFWDRYCHSGKVLGQVLSLWECFGIGIVTLGRFWDMCCHSGKVLG